MTKSASSVQVGTCRPRSTSLTRSQSVRLGRGGANLTSGCGERSDLRPRSSTLSSSTQRGENLNNCARSIQAGWRGHSTRTRDPQVQGIQEEMRSLRLEAHVKQLSKELRNARAALEQERKLRRVQTDTIRVLWQEVQSLQLENDLDVLGLEGLPSLLQHKNVTKKNQRLGKVLPGQWLDDSDSSRGEELLGEVGSGSSTSGVDDKSVADLSRTCASLQHQVENLQASLASVVRYVSGRSRHSSSSTCTPPIPNLSNSMTMSLPPSLTLPNPVTISRSCDSLSQTDIVAVKTPQVECFPFSHYRQQACTDVDTSDSDHTRIDLSFPADNLCEKIYSSPPFLDCSHSISPPLLDCNHPSPSRARSPRPLTLPGVGDSHPATPKRAPPRGSDIPGMAVQKEVLSPPGPRIVKTFALGLVQGILNLSTEEICQRKGNHLPPTQHLSKGRKPFSEKVLINDDFDEKALDNLRISEENLDSSDISLTT